jgi:hypothetical protein
MLVPGQTHVTGTVVGAFDAAGAYLGDVLVLDHDVVNPGGRWLLATAEFQAIQGLVADFVFPAGRLPVESGMVCWGAPIRGELPLDPASWDHADFSFYTDCVAYGAFCGRAPGAAAVAATPADHSLVRAGGGALDDDFVCSSSMSPTNNFGTTAAITGSACAPLPATICGAVIAGGKPLRSDCWGEWVVRGVSATNPAAVVCRDGDACDTSRAEGCVVRVQLCFDDVTGARYGGKCPLVPVQSFTLKVRQRDGVDRENLQTILAAVRTLGGSVRGVTVSLPEFHAPVCTGLFELVVPIARRRGRKVDGTRLFQSTVVGPQRDHDRVKLVCRP